MAKDDTRRFDVLQPVARKGGGTFWMRLGTAFENRDGSLNIYLDALPIAGRLQVRAARVSDEASAHDSSETEGGHA